jgi:transmembrane sensor
MSMPPLAGGDAEREELERVWSLLGRAPGEPVSAGETEAAWRDLMRRLELDGGGRDRRGTRGRVAPPAPRGSGGRDRASGGPDAPPAGATAIPRPAARPSPVGSGGLLRAALIAGLLLVGAAAWYQLPVTRAAAPGERLAVRLPDGSRATLNAGSEVRYRRGFSLLPGLPAGRRRVRLQGEAFFDVVPGERSFQVAAADASVRVLGTRFNVRSRPAGLEVAVEEGRVEVAGRGRPGAVVLRAGEAVRMDEARDRLTRLRVPRERVGAWRRGGLTVVDEPLSAILAELSRRFAVEVTLADPDEGGRERLSVYYPMLGSLESVLSDLTIQQDLRYRRTAEGWEVF